MNRYNSKIGYVISKEWKDMRERNRDLWNRCGDGDMLASFERIVNRIALHLDIVSTYIFSKKNRQ